MMKKIENQDFYEVLEISPSASTQDIHKAYERLRKLYDPNSIALYSLFTPEETAAIQQRIEEAYRTLIFEDRRRQYDASLKKPAGQPEPEIPAAAQPPAPQQEQPSPPPPEEPFRLTAPEAAPPRPLQPVPAPAAPSSPPPAAPKPVPEFTGEFTGQAIRSLREQSGRDLRAIADMTKVSIRYLELIEEETFSKLPARTYIRGFLMLYAKALGCNAERLAADYLRRYDAAMKPAKK